MWSAHDDSKLPSRKEINHVKSAIASLRCERDSLETKIATSKARRDEAVAQLKALQDEINDIDTDEVGMNSRLAGIDEELDRRMVFISPQRWVPNEILGEIFICHVQLNWKAPLIDAGVCRRWRSAALSTPRLWSYLRLPDPLLSSELTEIWLKRAGMSPLHIHINYLDVTAEILVMYTNVFCMKFRPWPTFLQGMSFSRLEKLILDHEDASVDHLERDVFMHFSKLRVLHLHWFRLSRRPLLQWAWDLPALEELHFAGASWAWIDAVDLVKESVRRLALDVGDVRAPPPSNVDVRKIYLPQLSYFAFGPQSRILHLDDSSRVPIISRIIEAPKLENFEDHTIIPLETALSPADNWQFPSLRFYQGRTSRELAEVKQIYPHVRGVAFTVDRETGVLDVATLIDSATDGELEQLEELEMYMGADLIGHPMIEQSLRKYEQAKGRKMLLKYHSGVQETPYQQCHFGFDCCQSREIGVVTP